MWLTRLLMTGRRSRERVTGPPTSPIYGTPAAAGDPATKVGITVRTVLRLSLASQHVEWVFTAEDATSSTVLDYDGFDVQAGAQIADAAARGAAAIATASGHRVDCVRVTWTDDVRAHGARLLDKLTQLGFAEVVVAPPDAPVPSGASPGRPRVKPRRRLATALVWAAAVIVIALCASAGSTRTIGQDSAPVAAAAAAPAPATVPGADDRPAVVDASPAAPLSWMVVDPAPAYSPPAMSYATVARAIPPAPASPSSPIRLPDQPHLPDGRGSAAVGVPPALADDAPAADAGAVPAVAEAAPLVAAAEPAVAEAPGTDQPDPDSESQAAALASIIGALP